MEKRSSSFEDHLNIVSSSHEKTASANSGSSDLLDKLAAQLGLGQEKVAMEGSVTAPGAPVAEGEVHPATSSVAGAPAAVVSATEAVATPQTAIAGGNPAEAAAGEIPGATKPNEGLAISAGDGMVTDANNLHRTPEAVAAAAEGPDSDVGGDVAGAAKVAPEKAGQMTYPEGQEKMAEAKQIGEMIAKSFQETLQKEANDQDYSEALAIVKEAGFLEGYTIKDEGMSKTASVKDGYLEKLANKQSVNREDIIGAAVEYLDLEKQAEDADAQGRADAQALVGLVSEIQKTAGEEGETPAATPAAAPAEAPAEVPPAGEEKLAGLLQNPQIVAAVKTLRENGVI